MTSSPSFERIDYQLRYNKHIERKIVFDTLARAKETVGVANYQYLGFGSMWFADFRLAHRMLGIDHMVSMEREPFAERARFNSPYHSIIVEPGDSTKTLEKIEWTKPVIAWLDYDGALTTSIAQDIRTVLSRCVKNSILIVTLNAARASYRPKAEGSRTRLQTALGQVEYMLQPGVVSARFEPPPQTGKMHGDVKESEFPEFLAEAVLSYMAHTVNGGGGQRIAPGEQESSLSFVPLFNICHKDGVDMITVGGAVAESQDVRWREPGLGNQQTSSIQFPLHTRLDLVPLTLKEKLVLDSCLPEPVAEAFLSRAKAKGIKLDGSELKKYWRHYNHFPVFFESPI